MHTTYKQLLIGLKLQNDSFPVDQSELLLFHFQPQLSLQPVEIGRQENKN